MEIGEYMSPHTIPTRQASISCCACRYDWASVGLDLKSSSSIINTSMTHSKNDQSILSKGFPRGGTARWDDAPQLRKYPKGKIHLSSNINCSSNKNPDYSASYIICRAPLCFFPRCPAKSARKKLCVRAPRLRHEENTVDGFAPATTNVP